MKAPTQIKTVWQHSEEYMCRLQNLALRDYQESVTTGQTHGRIDRRRTKLCFAGDTTRQKMVLFPTSAILR